MRRLFVLLAVLLSVSCTGGAPGPGGPGGDPGPGGGSGCVRPTEGCACDPGSGPVDCYVAPERAGDDLICGLGTQYCRGGVWTGCESVETFSLPWTEGVDLLVTGPDPCNPCNPDCFSSTDMPTDADLPGSSTGVVYDPGSGGITLPPSTAGGTLTDSDGDGVPDDADDYPMDPTRWHTVTDTAFFHTLPFGGPAEIDPFDFDAAVTTADVYFLMDTTGSMGGEINNLKSSLTTGTYLAGCTGGIVAAIRCTIPNAWFGVGLHDDYPVAPYGDVGIGDRAYQHFLDITNSLSAAQTAVNGLPLRYGYDWPESQSQALWAIATGQGLQLGMADFEPDRTGCPGGTWGYPCFRGATIPIVILFTDAPYHNGPNPSYDYGPLSGGGGGACGSSDPGCRTSVCSYDSYCCLVFWDSICDAEATVDPVCIAACGGGGGGGPVRPSWADTVSALNAAGIKVIVVDSSGCGTPGCASYNDALALTSSTGSISSTGTPFVFPISSSGTGLGTAVVSAVDELANSTRFDVWARPTDNPATPAVDERNFVASITAVSWGPGGDCTGMSGGTFIQCSPGTPVHFNVAFRNDFVMPTMTTQVFDFFIEVMLDASVQQRIPVRIVIPPDVPSYPPMGSYWREYDATTRCAIPPQRPDWQTLSWVGSTPSDSHITLEIRTADTSAGLSSAPVASVAIPPNPDVGSVDVAAELAAIGETNGRPYLKVTAVLYSSSDMTATSVLSSFTLDYVCMDIE